MRFEGLGNDESGMNGTMPDLAVYGSIIDLLDDDLRSHKRVDVAVIRVYAFFVEGNRKGFIFPEQT